METSIQVSKDLLEKLKSMKIYSKESYEDIIWDLIEDRLELSEETKKAIVEYEKNLGSVKLHKWDDVKGELGLDV